MLRTSNLLLAASAIAALTFASSASAQFKPMGDDGIVASPKVRQMLSERKATPSVAIASTMPCPKCVDVQTTEVNRRAKGAELLAGAATRTVMKHTCTACETRITTQGEGKARHAVATHKCTADVPKPATCCASK